MNDDEYQLKPGTISADEFVHLFGNRKQIETWESDHKYKSKSPWNTMLAHAKTRCQITENKNGTYTIRQIYKNPIPKNFDKMNSGLYKHIIPILLYRLIDAYEEGETLKFTIGHWAKEINMVNENYINGTRRREDFAYYKEIEYEYVDDFFGHTDSSLNNYIRNALEYLRDATLIVWDEPYNIVYDYSNVQKNWNNIELNKKIICRAATDKEMEYYAECLKIADEKNNIKTSNERFYSSKSTEWNKTLHRELWKRNIVTVYKTYRVNYVHIEKIKSLLKHFGITKREKLVDRLTRDFSKLVLDNADKRYQNSIEKYHATERYYHNMFYRLCKITIDKNADKIYELDPSRVHVVLKDEDTNIINEKEFKYIDV